MGPMVEAFGGFSSSITMLGKALVDHAGKAAEAPHVFLDRMTFAIKHQD